MLQNIVRPEWVEKVDYEVAFDDGRNNGFGFPCDESGKILPDLPNPAAYENYKWCLEHPERFSRFNKVIRRVSHYKEPAHGTCNCGEEVALINEYLGACQCPKCGQWYNLFGQELLPPEEWED
jgi:hypothetical protein